MTDIPFLIYVILPSSLFILLVGFIVWIRAKEKAFYKKQILERTRELEDEKMKMNNARNLLEEIDTMFEKKIKERTRELQEINGNLERMVNDGARELKVRTRELEQKIGDLQQFGDIFVNRENKMIDLKEKIRELENKLKEKQS